MSAEDLGSRKFSGVYAAILTPRATDGVLDLEGVVAQFALPAADGLTGYAVNGATGEFPGTTPQELQVLARSSRTSGANKQLLIGVGAPDVRSAVLRGKIAADEGADAVLLPMPSFFPYRQDDLRTFAMAVADAVSVPVLLYNLPQFTTGLAPETTVKLLQEHDNIVGVKDSSGLLHTLRAMTEANLTQARLIGNDGALCAAMEQGICDGVVSGVACALPELMTSLFAAEPGTGNFARLQTVLDEFIARLGALPTPWGLKVTSEVRGFTRASYPLPLSRERAADVAALQEWFQGWVGQAVRTTP